MVLSGLMAAFWVYTRERKVRGKHLSTLHCNTERSKNGLKKVPIKSCKPCLYSAFLKKVLNSKSCIGPPASEMKVALH